MQSVVLPSACTCDSLHCSNSASPSWSKLHCVLSTMILQNSKYDIIIWPVMMLILIVMMYEHWAQYNIWYILAIYNDIYEGCSKFLHVENVIFSKKKILSPNFSEPHVYLTQRKPLSRTFCSTLICYIVLQRQMVFKFQHIIPSIAFHQLISVRARLRSVAKTLELFLHCSTGGSHLVASRRDTLCVLYSHKICTLIVCSLHF